MQSTIVGMASTGLALFGLSFGIGAATIWEAVTNEPAEYSMTLKELHFDGERIGQNIIVNSKHPVPATWTAQIMRNGKQICAGSGKFNYEPRDGTVVKWMTPSEWTGDQCPPVQPGDLARATWKYQNVHGFTAITSGDLIIKPKG